MDQEEVVEEYESFEDGKTVGKKKRRPSYVTRLFGHFMDVKGPLHGTWIVGVLYLESCPTYDQLAELVKTKLLKMTRFKSVLRVNRKGAHFEELEDIDWPYHLGVAFAEEIISEDQLTEYLGSLFERGLDVDKPLWRFTLIPKLEDGRSALICVTNHAIGDGISTVGVLLNILDDSPIDPTKPLHKQVPKQTTQKTLVKTSSKLSKVSKESESVQKVEAVEEIVVDPVGEAEETETTPEKQKEKEEFVIVKRNKKPAVALSTRVSMFFYGIREGIVGPFGRHDPENLLKLKKDKTFDEKYTGRKLMAKSELLDLNELKILKNKFEGATVNDILLALLTMTVKRFLAELNDPVLRKKNPLRGNFPVSMRSSKEPILKENNPSNSWQPLAFRFPFDYQNAVDCVFKVKSQIDGHKVSPQLAVQSLNARLLTRFLSRERMIDVGLRLNDKVTAMLSNVPGPQYEVHVCNGIAIKELCFYVFSPLGIYLGLLSYAGKVSLCVNMDTGLGLDPKQMLKHWTESFQDLKNEVEQFETTVIPKGRKQRRRLLAKQNKNKSKEKNVGGSRSKKGSLIESKESKERIDSKEEEDEDEEDKVGEEQQNLEISAEIVA